MHIYMIMNADCNLIYFVYIYMYIRTVNVKCKEHIGCQVVSASLFFDPGAICGSANRAILSVWKANR